MPKKYCSNPFKLKKRQPPHSLARYKLTSVLVAKLVQQGITDAKENSFICDSCYLRIVGEEIRKPSSPVEIRDEQCDNQIDFDEFDESEVDDEVIDQDFFVLEVRAF